MSGCLSPSRPWPISIWRRGLSPASRSIRKLSASIVLAGPGARIGTVQCKHTSEVGKALKIADLTAEIGHVEDQVKAG
jgi:hypothetical protein